MENSSHKLKRLVLAQTVLENRAKGEVVALSAELAELEQQLEKTQDAFSSTAVTLTYSDFYIRHLHRLQTRCVEVRRLLESAQLNLQVETSRSRKLKQRHKSAAEKESQGREARDNLERVERTLFRSSA